ncbi:class I SAM-dependent methyltransferase [Streptomyces sp. NPDC005141]
MRQLRRCPFDLLGLTPWTRRCRPPVGDLRPHRHWIQRHPTSRSPIARLDRPGTGKRPHRCQCGCRYRLLRAGRQRGDRSRPLAGHARRTPWDEEGEGRSEALPFADGCFDAAMATTTVHHWPDLHRGLGQLRRVAGRQVVFTWDPTTGRSCGCLRSTCRRSAS